MNETKKFSAYFSLSSFVDETLPQNAILIYPSSDNWNDFGIKTMFVFSILGQHPIIANSFRLAFLGPMTRARDLIENILSERKVTVLDASAFPKYFSLQPDMDSYRKMVAAHGIANAENILAALNDLVTLRKRTPHPSWLGEALNSDAFSLSFMRSSESFFAYYNASSVLSGLAFENIKAAASEIQFSFKLESFRSEHKFNFKFDLRGLVPKRIAVLIGKNGVGKSQTLKQLVLAALGGGDTLTDGKGGRPAISRIIALCTPGETENTFPPIPHEKAMINYRRLSASPGEKTNAGGQTLPEVILQLARDSGVIGESTRWEIFQESVSRVLPFFTLHIIPQESKTGVLRAPLAPREHDEICIRDLRNGGEQRTLESAGHLDKSGQLVSLVDNCYLPLSSGQLSFVRLAAQLCLNVENGSLVLVDEPETHLHPNLVTDLTAVLNKILELSGSIAIVATHSAYFVREVPSGQVHVIKESENHDIEIMHPRLRTFGADVGAISNFVFGDGIINRLIEETEILLQKSPSLHKQRLQQLKGELSTEAMMHLLQKLEKSEDASE